MADLDKSLQWYHHMFGLTPEFVTEGSGPELSAAVEVPDARLRLAQMRFGAVVLELLCYENDRASAVERSNADVGSTHICVEVPDIDAAYAELGSRGAAFTSPPVFVGEGPLEGCSFAFFRGPDGVVIEILQHAHPPAGSH